MPIAITLRPLAIDAADTYIIEYDKNKYHEITICKK